MALSPSTIKVYVSTLKRVYGIDPTMPPKVEGTAVEQLPPGNYTEETTNSTRSIIRGAVRWWYSTASNPAATEVGESVATRIPFRHEVKKRKRYPSSEEIAAFWVAIAALPSPKKELLAIPLLLGLRSDEFLSLSREAVSQALQTGVLTVQRKGAKEGELPIGKSKAFFKSLFGLPKRATDSSSGVEPWQAIWEVFADSKKGAYFVFRRLVESTAKASGSQTKWTPHTLRHAFASEMIRAGAPLAVVQRALGHASYMTTVRTYVHIDVKDLEKWMDRADAAIEAAAPKGRVPKAEKAPVAPPPVVEVEAPLVPVAVVAVPAPVPVVEVQTPARVPVVEVQTPKQEPVILPSFLRPRAPVPTAAPVPVVRPRKKP